MTWYRLSPAVLTLLVFLLTQVLGVALLFFIGMQVTLLSLTLMAMDILAVLGCYFFVHNIHFPTIDDITSIRWRQGVLAIVGGILGALSISFITDTVEIPDTMLQFSIAMSHNFWGIITLAIIGPIAEEFLFREGIAGEMLRRGASPWMAIFVSSLAFGAMHLNLAQGLYAFPLGVLFGIIYYKTGSIVLTSILHMLNNSIVAVQLYTIGEDIADLSYAEWFGSTAIAYTVMALCGVLCILLMRTLWKS